MCWAGSSAHLNNHNRSIALSRFADILSLPHLCFISVQRRSTRGCEAILHRHGVVEPWPRDFESFSDTAAVVAELDLLVSVDTVVAHLAGAIAKPVALCCRIRRNGDGSPIAPTVPGIRPCALFRQTSAGDWDGPLARLHKELGLLAQR